MRARRGALRASLAFSCCSALFAKGRGSHCRKNASVAAMVEEAVALSALRADAGYGLSTLLVAAVRTQGGPVRPACSEMSLKQVITLSTSSPLVWGAGHPKAGRQARRVQRPACRSKTEGDDEAKVWGVLDLRRLEERWEARTALASARACAFLAPYSASTVPAQVPWGGRQLTVGLLAWASTFVAVGLLVMPLLARAVGVQVRASASPLQAQAAPRC